MRKVMVYFVNNNKAEFDRDKVCFRANDGSFFALSDAYEESGDYAELVDNGRVLINLDNVCFVKEVQAADGQEED